MAAGAEDVSGGRTEEPPESQGVPSPMAPAVPKMAKRREEERRAGLKVAGEGNGMQRGANRPRILPDPRRRRLPADGGILLGWARFKIFARG
jgi:hypothetical protein